MQFYLPIIILYSLLGIKNDSSSSKIPRKMLVALCILPMLILVAFRDVSVGTDTITYYNVYVNASGQSLKSLLANSRMELGYVVLTYSALRLGFSYFQLQVIISLFIYFSIGVLFYRYSSNIPFSCFVFVCMNMMTGTMNITRSWLAFSIFVFAIPCIQNRKPFKFLILLLLASLFHSSALVLVLLYPKKLLSLNKKKCIAIFSFVIVLFFIGKKLFLTVTSILGRYSNYVESKYTDTIGLGTMLSLLYDLGMFALYSLQEKKDEDKATDNNGVVSFQRICFSAIVFLIAFNIMGLQLTIMDRISVHFSVFLTFLIPDILRNTYKRSNKCFLYVFLVFLLIMYFVIIKIYRPNWNAVWDYKFFFAN